MTSTTTGSKPTLPPAPPPFTPLERIQNRYSGGLTSLNAWREAALAAVEAEFHYRSQMLLNDLLSDSQAHGFFAGDRTGRP